MPSRPVHWYEGMFLRPQHFQAADRHAREALSGLGGLVSTRSTGGSARSSSTATRSATTRSSSGRARRGSRTGPSSRSPTTPRSTRSSSKARWPGSGAVTVYLAVPALQPGRANVEETPDGRRPALLGRRPARSSDENTGGEEQPIQVRRIRCRLLLSNQDHTGYEVLPLARIERSAQAEAPPQLDVDYVPPLLALDAWPPLWQAVQSLYHQIGAKVDQLAAQIVDRGISFDSQVPGDAERLLKLSVLNGALSALRGDRLRPRADPAGRLPRALPAGRPARHLHRGPPAPDPAAVRPRGPRRLLLHGHQVHPARPRHDRPVGLREALLRAQRRAAPGQPRARLAEQHPDALPRASRPSWATTSASSSSARWT